MNDELKELISKADCGDGAAQQELVKRGDEASKAGDHEQAAYLYKMAAMAYRIAASREGTLAGEASGKLWWKEQVLEMYRAWIAKYTRPLAPRINTLTRKQLADDASHHILGLRRDDKFRPLVRYLEEQLMNHDVDFCTGSTINRHIYYMAKQQSESFWDFKHDTDVRIVLDPICDEIMYRVEHPKPERKTAKRSR